MKTLLLCFLFLSYVSCYDDVIDLGNDTVVMKQETFIIQLLIPWLLVFISCCVTCSIKRKYYPHNQQVRTNIITIPGMGMQPVQTMGMQPMQNMGMQTMGMQPMQTMGMKPTQTMGMQQMQPMEMQMQTMGMPTENQMMMSPNPMMGNNQGFQMHMMFSGQNNMTTGQPIYGK